MCSSLGWVIVPAPHGQRPASARNSKVLPVPGAPTMRTRSPAFTMTWRSRSMSYPVGDRTEIVDKPAQGRLSLRERRGGHHQAAEGNLPGEVQGCGDQYGRDDRDPAESGRDPCQVGETGDQAAGRGQYVAQMQLDTPPLVLLAGSQRDTVEVLIDAHQRESQVRLA